MFFHLKLPTKNTLSYDNARAFGWNVPSIVGHMAKCISISMCAWSRVISLLDCGTPRLLNQMSAPRSLPLVYQSSGMVLLCSLSMDQTHTYLLRHTAATLCTQRWYLPKYTHINPSRLKIESIMSLQKIIWSLVATNILRGSRFFGNYASSTMIHIVHTSFWGTPRIQILTWFQTTTLSFWI